MKHTRHRWSRRANLSTSGCKTRLFWPFLSAAYTPAHCLAIRPCPPARLCAFDRLFAFGSCRVRVAKSKIRPSLRSAVLPVLWCHCVRSTALFEIERRLTGALGWNETSQFAKAKESASALPCQTSEDYHHAARPPALPADAARRVRSPVRIRSKSGSRREFQNKALRSAPGVRKVLRRLCVGSSALFEFERPLTEAHNWNGPSRLAAARESSYALPRRTSCVYNREVRPLIHGMRSTLRPWQLRDPLDLLHSLEEILLNFS